MRAKKRQGKEAGTKTSTGRRGIRGTVSLINRFTDNLKLRTKMILICVLCVLVPVIGTDLIFWSVIYKAEQQRVDSMMDDVAKSTESYLDNMMDSLNDMTATFYTNSELYDFLDTRYEDAHEFYEEYLDAIDSLNVVYGNNTYIKRIVFYSNNDTLLDGGYIGKTSSVQDESWYKYFTQSGKEALMYAYYDVDIVRNQRTISLIRRLDYTKSDPRVWERLIKLDVSYAYCSRMLAEQHYSADVYICWGDNILFSNTDNSNGVMPFHSKSELDIDKAVRSFEYSVCGEPWQVYFFPSESSSSLGVADILRSHKELFATIVFINLLLPFTAIYILTHSITRRLKVLSRHMEMVKEGQYEGIDMVPSKDEVGDLVRHYNLMAAKIKELIENIYKEQLRRQENELQKQRAELQALHSQINPHFMFNALESIRMRSLLKREDETAQVIEQLAVMMRKSTDWGDDLVTVADEVAFAESYLRLQQYRFGDRLSFRVEMAPDCANYRIPKLTLVTFVENACVHGVEGVKRNCIIILSVEQYDGMLRIYIEDTGAGMSEERGAAILEEMRTATFDSLSGSKSIGIMNACLRLKNCADDAVDFELDSEEGAGTCITISIPTENLQS